MSGDKILCGIDEVAAYLRIHPDTLRRYARKFPPMDADFLAKLNGRWHVKASEAMAWLDYVKRQIHRHPDSRRMRPEEPPEVAAIQARDPAPVEGAPSPGGEPESTSRRTKPPRRA